jgi:hypothetical protein
MKAKSGMLHCVDLVCVCHSTSSDSQARLAILARSLAQALLDALKQALRARASLARQYLNRPYALSCAGLLASWRRGLFSGAPETVYGVGAIAVRLCLTTGSKAELSKQSTTLVLLWTTRRLGAIWFLVSSAFFLFNALPGWDFVYFQSAPAHVHHTVTCMTWRVGFLAIVLLCVSCKSGCSFGTPISGR